MLGLAGFLCSVMLEWLLNASKDFININFINIPPILAMMCFFETLRQSLLPQEDKGT